MAHGCNMQHELSMPLPKTIAAKDEAEVAAAAVKNIAFSKIPSRTQGSRKTLSIRGGESKQ
ncbi:MAG: hypothetical protein EBZ48_01695 [Proteobacteria bacterium]|nr:hypothetical protein [Pseudomonadota bacterium]